MVSEYACLGASNVVNGTTKPAPKVFSLKREPWACETVNRCGLIVAGVAVGRGCIRACHHPTIERQVARLIGILNLYRKRIAETQ